MQCVSMCVWPQHNWAWQFWFWSVMKDPVTGKMILQLGGWGLSAGRPIQRVSCIDELDKMLGGDRTAIHEVMEQQTVSISKTVAENHSKW